MKVNRDEVKIGEPDKIDELGWFKLTKLPKPLHTGFARTFKTYKKYFTSKI